MVPYKKKIHIYVYFSQSINCRKLAEIYHDNHPKEDGEVEEVDCLDEDTCDYYLPSSVPHVLCLLFHDPYLMSSDDPEI